MRRYNKSAKEDFEGKMAAASVFKKTAKQLKCRTVNACNSSGQLIHIAVTTFVAKANCDATVSHSPTAKVRPVRRARNCIAKVLELEYFILPTYDSLSAIFVDARLCACVFWICFGWLGGRGSDGCLQGASFRFVYLLVPI